MIFNFSSPSILKADAFQDTSKWEKMARGGLPVGRKMSNDGEYPVENHFQRERKERKKKKEYPVGNQHWS